VPRIDIKLSRLRRSWHRLAKPILRCIGLDASASPWNNNELIREELFGVERLEEHATSLAAAQRVATRAAVRRSLNARLNDNEAILLAAYRSTAAAVDGGQSITPAAEWLIDNYHLVEEQIRQINDDLPPKFYKQLPKLADGPFAGYPRVLGIAWAYIAHSDSRFDPLTLRRFVRAYQRVQPLTIGELWAVAITLRVVLVENLRRAAERIGNSRDARAAADQIADRLLGINGFVSEPDALLRSYEEDSPFSAAFVVQMVKRLRDQDPRVTPALQWLESRLTSQATNSDEVVHEEHQRQGASNVTVRNIITSMRLISDVNWPDFFEDVSLVDEALRASGDSPGDFSAMDFATRNLYRSAIEELSRGSEYSELQVTQVVLDIIKKHAHEGAADVDARKNDPGYYLLAAGRRVTERAIGFRAPLRHWPSRCNAKLGVAGYIGIVTVFAAVLVSIATYAMQAYGVSGPRLGLLALLGLIPALDLAVAMVNRAVMREIGATLLPAMALRDGIPPQFRTLVVVPTLLTTAAEVAVQLERLEVHYLASTHGELYFAILSDWTDAPVEHLESDNLLLKLAVDGVASLNRRHDSASRGERFHLLHRRRVWSEGQRTWMGWERKRGKLHELNRLLRGSTDTTFVRIDGQPFALPSDVRYVVTLDADTRLPRETVRRLIGKMAHPLNRPRFDVTSGRVVEGYGVMQPRVTPSLPLGREGSLFQRVFSSMNGIDPYAAAVSDVYQDLFGEGSYAGKGIYDLDAFELALADRAPDNSLLSHDLFEGTFARAGLVSDIEVIEEFPARYDVAAARLHRWSRGDWQLLPWIFGRGDAVRRGCGSLPLLARWKMLDNLRRTLSAPAILAALTAGWLLPLNAALIWTACVLLTLAVPPLLPLLGAIVPRRRGVMARSHWGALGGDLRLAVSQITFSTAFLAHQSWSMLDAVARTLFRMWVSHRNLLEWVTAAQAQRRSRLSAAGIYRRMLGSLFAAVGVVAVAAWIGGDAWWLSLPFAALWIAAPAIASVISASPAVAGRVALSADEAHSLRLVARRTWRYFETFVTSGDSMLPPDNFQEDPKPVLAHRTSPTNIGLYLMCAVSARDFGWVCTLDVVQRLEATLATLHRMQRFRGHFFNWYDTRDLRPLEPRYVSTVDSGNLAAHLTAVGNACKEWATTPLDSAVAIAGVNDSIDLLREALQALPDDRREHVTMRVQLAAALDEVVQAVDHCGNDSAPAELTAVSFRTAAKLAATLADGVRALAAEHGDVYRDLLFWAEAIHRSLDGGKCELSLTDTAQLAMAARLSAVATDARNLAWEMEFDFLLDPERKLLAIGYLVSEGALDTSCYDLLASEARLASFFAIAKYDAPTRHWFRLGRAVTQIGSGAALISWSGSMFEYLMPSLVMRAPAGSLLAQTNRLVVHRQIDYGASLGVPWGTSESAYNARDIELTYQYSNFGVPGLGLKRGLSENVVIAPYATALAAMVDPQAAVRNFAKLSAVGGLGRYGFYEALDYTSARLPENTSLAIVRAFMAHHQGMTIVAIDNVLFDGRMRARFHAEPSVQATELLLQERTPRDVSIAHPRAEETNTAAHVSNIQNSEVRRLHTPHHATPQTHLLSNGRYAVMLTSAGSGYSRWRDLAITRWREDTTRDDAGSYIFLREVARGAVWSTGYQPVGAEPDSYQVTFTEDRAEFIRSDGPITTTLQVVVSPEDDTDVRRVAIANSSGSAVDIDVTSYCELVLAPPAADAAHPAFSKLFVQTEYVEKVGALLATRRRRTPIESEMWVAHHCVVEGQVVRELEFETDRARFLGRGCEIHEPVAVMDGRPLSNSFGTVLDPVFALRYRVRVAGRSTATLSFWTSVAATRAAVLDLIDKHRDVNAFVRASTLSWTQAQVQLRHLGVTADEAILFQRLAGHVLYANAALRPPSDSIQRGGGARSALWAQGISGDVPLVLLRIDAQEDIGIARQLLQAHEYWRLKGLAVDLVILNERASSYVQDLQVALETLVRMSQSRSHMVGDSAKGSVFVLRTDLIAAETRLVLSAAARAVFVGQRGSLQDQLDRRAELRLVATRVSPRNLRTDTVAPLPLSRELEFFNGVGGFAENGREYAITLDAGQLTPAPWINVIANPDFGFQVAAEGSGYTWSVNSRENQLTQWSNDPVTDRPGEVLYVRDEETDDLWGPTVAPVRDANGLYTIRHGQGYSRFEHIAYGIHLELTMFVPLHDSIKIVRLKVRNASNRHRRLSVTAYAEWVLGTTRSASAPFIVTEMDAQTGAMFARNPWNAPFATRVAFADLCGRQTQWTGDRGEFLGRHGRLDQPAALTSYAALSKRVGAGLDPCCALQAPLQLKSGETQEIVFLLGEAASASEAQALLERYRAADFDRVLHDVKAHWDEVLGAIQVKTPDRSMDVLLNRWLLYQTVVCRIWARSAFYQASGAYGFRDQLQDGMALAAIRPAMTREHLLRAAGRQFPEGDVQHWWLPPTGVGVRTRISDDRIWLAYAAAQYLDVTHDFPLLDENVAFIDGAKLGTGEHDAFFEPAMAEISATFFEHCARGLDDSLALGAHGLPLIGTGDWNDGMNRVGENGRGESVWLGWFLHSTLTAFAPVAAARNESQRAARWLEHAATLSLALDREAWDGEWYRRGYFDDGAPLGSAGSDECRIDSIAQSWSVISSAGDPARAAQAMAAVDAHLIRRDEGLALLFAPPFDRTALEPGYVKGYPPGIRENGGQYTHAAAWSIIAFAKLGQGEKAAELFAMANPINKTATRTGLRRYKVEPYVVAADIYSMPPHVGRGGWTWYTGSAGWMYRAGIEYLLGLRKRGNELIVTPCIPKQWPGFEMTFKFGASQYRIVVSNPDAVNAGVRSVVFDGREQPTAQGIPLFDDGVDHLAEVTLG